MNTSQNDGEDGFVVTMFREARDDHTDCFPCRLASATGLLFGGLFIIRHRNNFGKINGIFQTAIGAGLITASLMRLLGVPPFEVKSENGLLFKLSDR